jgi:hypothetical protein
MAKVANMQALPERNVLKVDILRPPLDFIAEIIKANQWLYTYACIILMLIHRVTSELMLTSRSMPSLPRTGCSRRLCCTISSPQLVGVS